MNPIRVVVMLALTATVALADFSFKYEFKLVGGSEARTLLDSLDAPSNATDWKRGTFYLKGNRSATANGTRVKVVDLDERTVINIDHAKRQYSVTSFTPFFAAFDRFAKEALVPGNDFPLPYKVSVRVAQQAREIDGYPAELAVVSALLDKPGRGKRIVAVEIVEEMWLSTAIPGATEWVAMQNRLSELEMGAPTPRLDLVHGFMGRLEMREALMAASTEWGALKGIPVLIVHRLARPGNGSKLVAVAGSIPPGAIPVKGVIEARPASEFATIETATRHYDFTNEAIDDAIFEVPADYKQVSPMAMLPGR